ncbi:tetratricopeptide repeat protein [Pelagicoccus mobilis]|uniref:Sel1 repeat family protein n=1 Tax=Pelagicoccus mobilis TaxID=415221 RepID=A0A934RYQ1_9BACT|nr:SEL1-like repeat protein [Pelagicoccus mobilis]MBK1876777.1 sel1 repeat family protein [Pelagicoccus mobilis]
MFISRLVLFLGFAVLSGVSLHAQEAFDDEAFEASGELEKAERDEAFAEVYGAFVSEEYRKAIRGAKPLARRGMADAQHLLGLCYQHGLGVKANGKRAEYWFRLAAEQRHAPAMLAAGEFAFGGSNGGEADHAAARLYLKPLTGLDWSFAQRIEDLSVQRAIRSRASYLMGLLLIDGLGGEKQVEEGLLMMNRASATGDAWASMYLAMAYAEGKLMERDAELSKQFFEQSDLQAFDQVRRNLETTRMESASPMLKKQIEKMGREMAEVHTKNLVQSQTNLAKALLVEGAEDHDPESSRVLLRMASEAGNTEASFLLGYLLCEGIGGGQDFEEGARLLEAASEKNWVLANYNLAVLLLNGWGVGIDEARADTLLDRAAESGFYSAQLLLEREVEPELLRDIEDLERCEAAESSDVRASYAMGMRLARGWLVEATGATFELRERFRLGAAAGYARSQHAYAEFYYWGHLGERDYGIAREYFEAASAQEHAQSYFKVGYIYEKGLGVEADALKAVAYYERASDFGDAWAANNLGAIHTDGELGEKDYEKAMDYYLLAVERGHVVACFNIAEAYLRGRGREVDKEAAAEWYTKAADGGDLLSAQKLQRLYSNGTFEGDDGEYAYWVERCAEMGDKRAMLDIARFYERGVYVSKNLDRSLYWINKYMETVLEGTPEWESAVLALIRLMGTEDWHGHDPEKAFLLCEELEFAEAKLILGMLHLREISDESDPKKGVSILKRVYKESRKVDGEKNAAAKAAYELSNCYLKGNGVRRDMKQRVKWMEASAEIGFKPARYYMARYKIEGVEVKRDELEGLAEMDDLADKGMSLAILYLGRMMANGELDRPEDDLLWIQIKELAVAGNRKAMDVAQRLGIEWKGPVEAEELDPEETEESEGKKEKAPEWSPSVLG